MNNWIDLNIRSPVPEKWVLVKINNTPQLAMLCKNGTWLARNERGMCYVYNGNLEYWMEIPKNF